MSYGVKVRVTLGGGLDKTYHTITHASEEDEGNYFCRAQNTMGVDEANATVALMGKIQRYFWLLVVGKLCKLKL